MSAMSQRGSKFELQIASCLRKKLGAKVTRDKQSGAGVNKADISDYYQTIPFHIEAKDHERINIKDWMRQAINSASGSQKPTLVFKMDDEVIAALRFSDLIDLTKEVQDLQAIIADLRQPETIRQIQAQ